MEEDKGKEEVISTIEEKPAFEEVEKKEPVFQEVETKKKEVRTDSYFDGGVLELIGWRLLGFIITAATLGIAYPWAQCMIYSWQFKHTVYNGKRLKFEGTGGDLFVNIFKWIFFTIITLGIYILFIPVRKARWVVSNIHYEDEEFVKDESFFDGNTLQLIGINILTRILTVFSLGLLFPFAECIKLKWINKHSIINRKKLVFDGNGFQLWGKYILWCFLTIITFGIFSLWMPILMLKWQTKHTHIKVVGEEEKKDNSLLILIPIVLILVVVMSIIVSSVIPKVAGEDFEEFMETFRKKGISAIFDGKKQYSDNSKSMVMEKQEKDYESASVQSQAKTSITVGGYTLKFGRYTGVITQFDWEAQKEIKNNITLTLSDNNITINGQSGSYTISGRNLVWRGDRYTLEVTGNNRIRYNAETCPILVYQGK